MPLVESGECTVPCLDSLLSDFPQDGFNLELQVRQVALDDCPHDVDIDPEIIVTKMLRMI